MKNISWLPMIYVGLFVVIAAYSLTSCKLG